MNTAEVAGRLEKGPRSRKTPLGPRVSVNYRNTSCYTLPLMRGMRMHQKPLTKEHIIVGGERDIDPRFTTINILTRLHRGGPPSSPLWESPWGGSFFGIQGRGIQVPGKGNQGMRRGSCGERSKVYPLPLLMDIYTYFIWVSSISHT